MIYDACGKPIRKLESIVEEMLGKDIDYKVVPKGIDGYGSNRKKFSGADIKYGGGWHKVVIFEMGDIHIGEHVPDRFRPIIASHEYGHRMGLTHQEIFNLELAMANHLASKTLDPTLKEDYIRWSSSNDMFREFRGNLGHEVIQESWDFPEKQYAYQKRKHGAEMVLKKEGNELVQVY